MRRPFPHCILDDIARHPAPRSSRLLPPRNDVSSRLLGCTAIVIALVAFFWAYDTAAHRDAPVGNWMFDDGATRRGGVHALIAPAAPAPDMHSAAISFANSDVPKPSAHAATPARQAAAAEPDTAHAAAPKKPRREPAMRLSPEAANAYAASPRPRTYSRPEIGAAGSF
jgi:hypothetical protein